MKCDTCKFKLFHSAGSFQSVSEGGDDPYSYEYCAFGYWCGGEEIENGTFDSDPWEGCRKYKKVKEGG